MKFDPFDFSDRPFAPKEKKKLPETETDEKCTCASCEEDYHPCPYAEEIDENSDPEYCNCCPVCTKHCSEQV